MFARRTPLFRLFMLASLLLSIWSLVPGAASAQEPDPAYDLQIGIAGDAAAEIPTQTVNVAVFNEDQTVDFGSCQLVTDAIPGGCTIDVPAGTTITAVVDEAALPAGIGVAENPVSYTTPDARTGMGDFSFEFVYTDDGGEEPVLDYDLQLMLTGDALADVPDQAVAVTVLSEDQSVEYGSCLMDMVNIPGGCNLSVPANTVVTAVLDESTLPEGIVVLENPVSYTTPAEKTQLGDIWFELAYAEGDTDGDDGDNNDVPAVPAEPETPAVPTAPGGVTQLPTTGSGPLTAQDDVVSTGMVILSSTLAVLMGVGSVAAQTIRRQ